MALDACPECHADISDLTSEELKAHRNDHWEGDIPFPNVNKLAVERSKALDEEAIRREGNERRNQARRTLGTES